MIVWLRLVALPHTSVAVQVAVLVCRQLLPLATKFDSTLNKLQSLNNSTRLTTGLPQRLFAALCCPVTTAGASVSSRMIVWLRLVALPHTSVAVQVAVLVCRQLLPLATKLDTTLNKLQSLNTGALNTSAVPHRLVASLPCPATTAGASVSSRMIVWLRLVALPHT